LKRKIVFIPTYDYLSDALFCAVAPLLGEYNTVYCNTRELIDWDLETGGKKKGEILRGLDEYREVAGFPKKQKLSKLFSYPAFNKNLRRLLSELEPAAVVTTSDMSASSKFAAAWAKERETPFIVLQPSFFDSGAFSDVSSISYRLKYLLFNRVLSIPLAPEQKQWGNESSNSRLLLWGDYFKELFRGLSVYERISVTGNPLYDDYFTAHRNKEEVDDETYAEYELPEGRRIVAICTEGMTPPEYREARARLNSIYLETVKKRKDLFFVIKLHPRDLLTDYENVFNDLACSNFTLVKDIQLKKLYRVSSVQVSVCSVSSFEAVVAGVPIILVNPDDMIAFDDFFQNKIELRAKDVAEFERCIDRSLTEDYRQEFEKKRARYLEEMIGGTEGKAAERTAEAILEIIEKNPKMR
jgi:hypothetical protein